jgi:hypothetical protein
VTIEFIFMKLLFVSSVCCFAAFSLPAVEAERLTFPSFGKGDLAGALLPFSPSLSVPELRTIMAKGKVSDQDRAARILIAANDQAAILRLVYALKQGNPVAEQVLIRNPSVNVVPFLIEEVAHGSLVR